jgi:hypothetical protein
MDQELRACHPIKPKLEHFNPAASLPYGLTTEAIRNAMLEFTDFLEFVNTQLNSKGTPRLESMFMPANFSSIVRRIHQGDVAKTLSEPGRKSVSQWPPRSNSTREVPKRLSAALQCGNRIEGIALQQGVARTQSREYLADGVRF